MKAYTYIEKGRFELIYKPKPEMLDSKDAIVRVTLSSICSSDLHIKHGGVSRAVPGITVGHEVVNILVDEKYLDAAGNPDVAKMNLITYEPVSHSYVALGEKIVSIKVLYLC